MSRLTLPDEEALPPGPRRDFVLALWELFLEAGEPTLKSLGGPPASQALRGVALPTRKRLTQMMIIMRDLAQSQGTGRDINALAQKINDAWRKDRMLVGAVQGLQLQTGVQVVQGPRGRSDRKPGVRLVPGTPGSGEDQVTPEDFRFYRGMIGDLVGELTEQSLLEQPADVRAEAGIPLLSLPGWIPDRPISLDHVHLDLSDEDDDDFAEAKQRVAPYWPRIGGVDLPTYSQAVNYLARPHNFFNGMSYRLLKVQPQTDEVSLSFTMGRYFDAFDTSEPLGFEASVQYHKDRTVTGPYRRWLNTPFDLYRRCAIPGVNTLTIRKSGADCTFYLHRRDSVATAAGTAHVVPAGEFQPSVYQPDRPRAELDLRSTIIREYAEEFLGIEDILDQGQHETQVDFEKGRFKPLSRAIREPGGAKLFYLGIGIYPLTWKPEILMVAVFEDRLFDRLFAKMVKRMFEGELLVTDRLKGFRYALPGKKGPYQGIQFDEATVRKHAENPKTLAAARACLSLAWRHRDALGIAPR